MNSAQAYRKLLLPSIKGEVHLRKNREEITDAVEIVGFFNKMDVNPETFLSDSNINLNWRIDSEMGEGVLSLGPRLDHTEILNQDYVEQAGFLSPEKFAKVKIICDAANAIGFPCPVVFTAGFDAYLQRAYMIQERAPGVNFAVVWDELQTEEKENLCYQLGALLTILHNLDSKHLAQQLGYSMPNTSTEWYRFRITNALHELQDVGVYTPETVSRIILVMNKLVKELKPIHLHPIHGDILHHNIFVKKNDSSWVITSVIDWETSLLAGDPSYDILLGAWWMAGEHAGNKNIFQAMLSGYNSVAGSVYQLRNESIDLHIALADLTWYLNILPYTWQRESVDMSRRIRNVERIATSVERKQPYVTWAQ